jgi:hypothetical protein
MTATRPKETRWYFNTVMCHPPLTLPPSFVQFWVRRAIGFPCRVVERREVARGAVGMEQRQIPAHVQEKANSDRVRCFRPAAFLGDSASLSHACGTDGGRNDGLVLLARGARG